MKAPIGAMVNAIAGVTDTLLRLEAKRATKYLSEKLVVSAQRRSWKNKLDRRAKSTEIVLKIGAPNYAEREFIKRCKKAGEPFPVKKIQVKYFPNNK